MCTSQDDSRNIFLDQYQRNLGETAILVSRCESHELLYDFLCCETHILSIIHTDTTIQHGD